MERNFAGATSAVGEGERADGQRSKGASGLVIVGELQDLGACVVFPFHEYKIPQIRQNAMIFLRLCELFLLMGPPLFLKKIHTSV